MTHHVKPGSARPRLLLENDSVRVTEWNFPRRGDNTGWHHHKHDYLIVPMHDGILEINDGTGQLRRSELKAGAPYFRRSGVEHDVINANEFEYSFIEVELLSSL